MTRRHLAQVSAALHVVGECKRIIHAQHAREDFTMALLDRLQALTAILQKVPAGITEAEAAAVAAAHAQGLADADAAYEPEVAKLEAAAAALPQPAQAPAPVAVPATPGEV